VVEYSSERIASRIRDAQVGGWRALNLGGLGAGDRDILQLLRMEGIERLESLDLSSNGNWHPQSPGRSSPDEITDVAVKALAASCPQLQLLDLSLCWKVTDHGLEALANGCSRLQSVGLGLCRQITDAGVGALAKGCPNLQSLDLSMCWQITDCGIKALVASCSRLQWLNLTACEEITDAGIQALVRACPSLSAGLRHSSIRSSDALH
jgi:bacterioferritin-associated ferredoxin